MSQPWAITPEKIDAAVKRIVGVARPHQIILFGSTTSGKTGPHSDLDILVVVEDEKVRSRRESVRIRRALRDICMPMDILVVPKNRLRELADRPGLIYREALRTGKVVYESAA